MHSLMNFSNVNSKESTLSNDMYLIELEVVGGCSQYAQVTKEQAVALGVQFPAEEAPKEQMNVQFVTLDNETSLHLNNSPVKKIEPNVLAVNYKIVQPEDLNLKQKDGPPRGRPKNPKGFKPSNIKPAKVSKVLKVSRTRYGRVTRPPLHMEKNYEKIVTDEDKHEAPRNNKDVSTTEFAPLKTNQGPLILPALTESLEKRKKRSVPARYRCPTCQKAFLGRLRLEGHLKKNPDHGSSQLNLVDCETWGFLIDLALKSKDGNKGQKFCNELLNLIKNARVLVKYFIKPGILQDYYMDSILSSVLEVDEGHYRFKENEICKDVSIFSFLEYIETYKNIPKDSEIDEVLDILKPCAEEEKINPNTDIVNDVHMEKDHFENVFNCDNFYTPDKKEGTNTRPIYDLPNNFVTPENIGFEFESKLDKSNQNYFNPKQSKQPYNIIDHNMEILKSKDSEQEKAGEQEIKHNKKIDDFDLRKLHLLGEEELILPVNILDTSTNSDDIMNVDQFVNERFKKLTETDDLHNTSLNLELPALECFDFNTH